MLGDNRRICVVAYALIMSFSEYLVYVICFIETQTNCSVAPSCRGLLDFNLNVNIIFGLYYDVIDVNASHASF